MRKTAAINDNAAGMASEKLTDQTARPVENRQSWKASPGIANW
jgi:hypothetical protein